MSVTKGQARPMGFGARSADMRPGGIGIGLQISLATLVLTALLLLFYSTVYPLHHDLAGSALSGRLAVILGDSYQDYSVYFPPIERVWFSTAAQITHLTGLPLDLSVVLITSAAVMFSAALAYHVRRETVGARPTFLILSVALLVLLPIFFKNVFGLREHLVALGLWPYLVARVSDPDTTRIASRTRIILGVWLGTTLLFKYLYSAVVLLVEIMDALTQRRPRLVFRAENIIAGLIVGLYLLAWLGLDPSQRQAISAMISAIDANLAEPSRNLSVIGQNIAYSVAFTFLLLRFRVPARLILVGLCVVTGAVIAAWAQQRWYTHHLFPIVLAYCVWWWMARRYLAWWCHVALGLCVFYASLGQFLSTSQYREQVGELDQAMASGGASVIGKRVGILAMHPSPYNQYLVSSGAVRWNSLMNNAYVAAELKPFDKLENVGKLPPPVSLDDPGRHLLHDQMLRLWEDTPPDILILDQGQRWPLRYINIDWHHVFSKDERFRALMKRYRPQLVHKGRSVSFTYYVRAD